MKKTISQYPSFSVLMSVYKKEQPNFLDKALESLEQQTILPKEIVLVKDGILTPELDKVIISHENKHTVKYIIVSTSKNNGLAAALHLGTKYVSTDWIARMDSDDYSVKDRFEKQLNAINRNPDLAVVGGQVKEFANNIKNTIGYRIVPENEKLIYDFIKWRNPFNHPTVMINKSKLELVGGYKSYGNLEDYYLWSRMIAKKLPMINLDDVLTYMRVDDGMYARRGKISNIKYFYKLRSFLRSEGLINLNEKIIGDMAMTMNIIMPNSIRKIIYQRILHKNKQ